MAARITVIYAILGALWILFSDLAVRQLFGEHVERLTLVQTIKGWFFILATAILLYVLIRRGFRELEQAESALRRSESSLAKAQAIAHLGSWEWDLAADHVVWSSEKYRIFGVDPETCTPTYDAVLRLVHPEDRERFTRAIRDAVEHGRSPYVLEHRIVRPDGSVRVIAETAEVERDSSGRPIRLIGTALDITDRTRAADELRQLNESLEQRVRERTVQLAEAVEDLRAFSYTISHDLRTPLRTIRRFAEAMLHEHHEGLSSAAADYARRIAAAAARMDQLTAEILEYSQIAREDLVLQRISAVLVLHDVIGQLTRTPGFTHVDVAVREPMPWVRAHRTTLASVFAALLNNAALYVPPGATPRIEVTAEDRGEFARIWFIDNGIGISPEDQQRIFGLFERAHDQAAFPGTGIGLAIARRGVERMGGRIGVESTPGAGSRFWVDLPRDPQSP